jgi:hypothetical protein
MSHRSQERGGTNITPMISPRDSLRPEAERIDDDDESNTPFEIALR